MKNMPPRGGSRFKNPAAGRRSTYLRERKLVETEHTIAEETE